MKKSFTSLSLLFFALCSVAQEWEDPITTTDWNLIWKSSFIQSSNAANAPENTGWFWGLNMNHGSNNASYRYNGQLAIKNSSTTPTLYFRSTDVNGAGTWTKVLHNTGNQNINGSLYIGNTAANSFAQLVINGPNSPSNANSYRDISFQFSSAGSAKIRSYRGGSWDTYLQFLTSPSSGNTPAVRMHINSIGAIGIGTENPSNRLHLSNLDMDGINLDNKFRIRTSNLSSDNFVLEHIANTGNLFIRSFEEGDISGNIVLNDLGGNVSIGSVNSPTAKLNVNGDILAEEVKVVADVNNVPDYVFEKDYQLNTLQWTEEYIKSNHHLPEIPSAAEIAENGLNLGDMELKLLQKIEELTLHLIQQNKEIQELRNEVNKLKSND